MKSRIFLLTLLLATLSGPVLYCQDAATPTETKSTPKLAAPKIIRDAQGTVTLTNDTPGAFLHYTLDGSDAGPKSGPYLAPILLPQGGTIRVRAYSEDRKQMSDPAETTFPALPGVTAPPSTLVPVTQDRDWPTYDWAKRHAAVTEWVRQNNPKLVFIGDSITQMFGGEPHDRKQSGNDVWEKFYSKRITANLGFGYDYVENTLWRIQHGELDGATPRVIVVMLGTNNLGKNTPEEIAAGLQALIKELQTRMPNTKLLMVGILPRGEKPGAIRQKLAAVNQLIAKFDGITYVDAGDKLVNADGTISREIMGDFLHPTARGYTILAEAIEPTLSKLLGDTK